jgi:hypothetical protein
LDEAAQADAELIDQLPTYLANELARLLGEDAAQAPVLAERAPDEPIDPEEAGRALVRTLLDALRAAGSPGLDRIPQPPPRSLLGRLRTQPPRAAYFLGDRKARPVYVRAESYQATLSVWITPEGAVEVAGDGELANPLDDVSVAAMLYRRAAEEGIRPPVPAALRTHWDWPQVFR